MDILINKAPDPIQSTDKEDVCQVMSLSLSLSLYIYIYIYI